MDTVYINRTELQEVDTVSNKDLGLHLYMTDFNNIVNDPMCRFQGGEYWEDSGRLKQGIYSSIIPEGREFPTFTNKANTVRGYQESR